MKSQRMVCCALWFAWNVWAQFDPHFKRPSSNVIVHLFEWPHVIVQDECVRYLSKHGLPAVQLSPVNEVRLHPNRSWRERYEPVSYNLSSRSGSETQLKTMVNGCNLVGVRIFVEVVLNSMAGGTGEIRGTAGSVAFPSDRYYPGVPYSGCDFHDACVIGNQSYPYELRICQLNGQPDLIQGLARVRQQMVAFMNKLIALGVAGFYVHAAKNMWPHDLQAIYSKLNNLSTTWFVAGSRPFIYQDVQDLESESSIKNDYTQFGKATEYRFAYDIAKVLFKRKPFHSMISIGTRMGYIPRERAVVFLDSPELQRLAVPNQIISFKYLREYKIALTFMLTHRYGMPRIMSSYEFTTADQGPPTTVQGIPAATNVTAPQQCTGGWICEHRWPIIQRLIKFRIEVADEPVINWADNGQNLVAFCRGKVGFVAFNVELAVNFYAKVFTCLGPGVYCDIVSGGLRNNNCTGVAVRVEKDGKAIISIRNTLAEPFIVLLKSEKIK